MSKFVQPDPNKVLIVDISKWQDDPHTVRIVDFVQLKGNGVSGVIVKCGEANAIDRAFLSYVAAMEQAEIPYGVYWYYNNKYPPKKQAQLLINTLEKNNIHPKLGIWLDLEDRNPGGYMGWRHWYDFLLEVKMKFPKEKIGIYTGHYYFTEFTIQAGISAASLGWFAQFPLWIASYGRFPLPTKPWGDSWTLWQFTDVLDGIKFGVESKELDGNYFNGTMEEFQKFFGLEVVQDGVRKLVKVIHIYSDGSSEEFIGEQVNKWTT